MAKYLIIGLLFLLPLVRTAAGQRLPLPHAGFSSAHPSNTQTYPRPFSDPEGTVDSSCEHLAALGRSYAGDGFPSSFRIAYDTLTRFIEQCASTTTQTYGRAWHAFLDISACVSGMSTDNDRWLQYREWLKKVLYLSSDTLYYCADAGEMISTFNYLVPGKGKDINGMVALFDYLIASKHCPSDSASLQTGRDFERGEQLRHWRDTVKDTLATPIDTSSPSIDSLGFSVLRGPEYGAVPRTDNQGYADFGALIASRNPFSEETTLETMLGDATMLRLEIFDVLGMQVYAENQFFGAGNLRWRLDGKALPKGALYARISTIGGAVRTIKLIRSE